MHQPDAFAQLAEASASAESALHGLHGKGATPIEAILALHRGRGMSLPAAKQALHASAAWSGESSAASQLHDAILDGLDKLGSDDDREASN